VNRLGRDGRPRGGRSRPPLGARIRRALAAAATLSLVGAVAAPTSRADGDPASDYLLSQQVFVPFDAKFPAERQAQFAALVGAANRAGFKIRVALISSSYDMGSVTALDGKPRTYARFLGAEIAFVYRQRLLVVMPNGFGFNWPKHSAAPAYAVLAKIPIKPGTTGPLDAAQKAVQRLAAADGIKVSPRTDVAPATESRSHPRLIIIAATFAAVALAVAARTSCARKGHRKSARSKPFSSITYAASVCAISCTFTPAIVLVFTSTPI
jgi:hypothetical protein